MRKTVFGAVTVLAAAAGSAWAQEFRVDASKDNTLYESSIGALSNGRGQHMFAGRTLSELKRRALIRFDVAGAFPPGATITSAKLELDMSMTIAGAETIKLHRVLADWGEGNSDARGEEGGGDTAATGDATWIHTFYNSQFWEDENGRPAPGGWFDPTVSGAIDVDQTGRYTWGSTPGMVADVQDWLDNPARNFGWIIIGNEVNIATAKRFDTRDHPIPAFRPALVIQFSIPCYADCDSSTGVGVLDIFDFLCFQNLYAGGDPYACECDTSTGPGQCDIFDFLCFQNAFAGGCP